MDQHDENFLMLDLEMMITRLQEQIETIEAVAIKRGIPPLELQLPDGRWALSDLLCAKANVMAAYATLKGEK